MTNKDDAGMAAAGSVVFIDSRVPDLAGLIAGAAPGETVVVLDVASDGVQQIADYLSSHDLTGLASISIVGHGAPGAIALGSTTLDDSELRSDSAALAAIGAAVAPGGALELYACDTAAGTTGQEFIADLSHYAGGVDVAASTHLVGAADGGGSWTLDASTDPNATPVAAPFTAAALAGYQGELYATSINDDQPALAMHQLVVTSGLTPGHGSPTTDGGGIPIGAIRTFAGNFTPAGTNAAQGQLLSISADTELFSILGTAYGGNGTSNFALPNLDETLAVGGGSTGGTLGATNGSEYVTLTGQNMPSSLGGSGQAFDNDQPSLQINYIINTGGVAPSTSGDEDFLGEVVPFLGTYAPTGYMFADGQILSINANAELFDLLGTTYGGNGTSTFALPDLAGKTIIGTGTTAAGVSYTLGETVGQDESTISSANIVNAPPVSNYQPSLALNYIVCVQGYFAGNGDPTSIPSDEPIVGEIAAYAGTAENIPAGWLPADGRLLSSSQNAQLYSVFGTYYGGNGTSNFALPNLDGAAVEQEDNYTVTGESLGSSAVALTAANLTIAPPMLAAVSQTGAVTTDTAIDNPLITGSAPAGTTVTLTNFYGTLLGTTVANSSNQYTFVVSPLGATAQNVAQAALFVTDTLSNGSVVTSAALDLSIATPGVYYLVSTGTNTAQLWEVRDGFEVNTQITPISNRLTDPTALTQVGARLFFVDHATGALWVTDGLSSETVPLTSGVSADDLTAVGQTLYFVNDTTGKLWTSDGTVTGTAAVASAGRLQAEDLTAAGNPLFFINAKTDDLWSLTPGGTAQEIASDIGTPADLTAVGTSLYFVDSSTGSLWTSNGTTANEIGTASAPANLTADENLLYFSDSAGDLLTANGTQVNTVASGANPIDLTAAGPDVYYVNSRTGDLWNATTNVDLTTTHGAPSLATDLTAAGGDLYFTDASGSTLWDVDGNSASVVGPEDSTVVPSSITNLANVSGELYFEATSQFYGYQLWSVYQGQTWLATRQSEPSAPTLSDITAGPRSMGMSISSVAAITSVSTQPTITFSFDNQPFGFSNADVTTVGGSLGTLSQQSADVYTATFTPTAGFDGEGSITVTPGSYTDAYGVAGAGASVSFSEDAPCYCRGTSIRTARSRKRVEKLKIGDKVMTRSGVARAIKWIGRRSYGGRFVLGRKDILPICIKAGAIDDNVPQRDLWISPHHAMYLENVLIEAKDLVNGVSIVQAAQVETVEYFHIELDSHDVIIAEGALSESFIDDDSRAMFHNADEYRTLYPDAATGLPRYCAPRLDDGYQVETARRRIAARAGLCLETEAPGLGALRGYVDMVGAARIAGWAQNVDHPEAPVCLDIVAGGRLIGQVLAGRYRSDLEHAGLGSGRHSFEFTPPAGLAPDTIAVRRSLDGAALTLTAEARRALEPPRTVETKPIVSRRPKASSPSRQREKSPSGRRSAA